jgi:hypothetical protein
VSISDVEELLELLALDLVVLAVLVLVLELVF